MPLRPMRWFDRSFTFDAPADVFPGIVERLRGTPARLEERLAGITTDRAPPGDGWSLFEQVGHLDDLEALWLARVHDFLAGRQDLTPADLSNTKTQEANHRATPLTELLARFRRSRAALIERLDALAPGDVERTALHPRLQQPMRLMDLAIFVAEHDDHHLAMIGWLLRS